jgi:hypothetical protein
MDILPNILVPAGVSAIISVVTFGINILIDRRTSFSVRPGFEWDLLPGAPKHIYRRTYGRPDASNFFDFGEPLLFVEVTNRSKFDIFIESVGFPQNHNETATVATVKFDHATSAPLKPGEARRFYAEKSDTRLIVNRAYSARVRSTNGKTIDFAIDRYSNIKDRLPILPTLSDSDVD